MEKQYPSSLPNDLENFEFAISNTWGPLAGQKIPEFAELPFAPFNRLKFNLAPFNQFEQQGRNAKQQYYQQKQQQNLESQALKLPDDDFKVVETKVKAQKQGTYQQKRVFRTQAKAPVEDVRKQGVKEKKTKKKKLNTNRQFTRTKWVQFKDSVTLKSSFKSISEIDKTIFEKTVVKDVSIEEIKTTGSIKEWNWGFNRVNVKQPKELKDYQKEPNFVDSNSQKDKVFFDLLEQNIEEAKQEQEAFDEEVERVENRKKARQERKNQEGGEQQQQDDEDDYSEDSEGVRRKKKKVIQPPKKLQQIYVTDSLLVGLMTLKNSEFPWDIKVYKEENTIFLDKYNPESASYLDYVTINENTTTQNILPTDEADVLQICKESTSIQEAFQRNATDKGTEFQYGEEENELENCKDRSCGFKYMKVNLDDKVQVNLRTQVDAYEKNSNGEIVPLLVRTLNEYELIKTEWRKKMALSMGALSAQLQINNLCLMNKWLLQMYLSGAQKLKLGYVSRNQRDPQNVNKHTILKVDTYTYAELKDELKVNPEEAWVIVKYLATYLQGFDDGSYVLIKHPYKSSLKFYSVPEADEEDEEDDEDEDEDDQEVQEQDDEEDEE